MKILRDALYGFTLTIVLAALLSSGGCTALRKAEERAAKMTEQNQQLQNEVDRLQARLEQQNGLTARLQMELVQKKEEIARLRATGQGLAKEIASNTIRTPAAKTRVETVAYLAEVQTEIETARTKAKPDEQELFVEAADFMAQSNRELESDRYEQAALLAAQALEMINRRHVATGGETVIAPAPYADFITPIDLKVAKNSNIRKAPGIRSKVIAMAAEQTSVTAIGHKGYWIKVVLDDGRNGWIHYSLLSIPGKL